MNIQKLTSHSETFNTRSIRHDFTGIYATDTANGRCEVREVIVRQWDGEKLKDATVSFKGYLATKMNVRRANAAYGNVFPAYSEQERILKEFLMDEVLVKAAREFNELVKVQYGGNA